jgi:5-methylcytosine-specific restriction endonuclease McrA
MAGRIVLFARILLCLALVFVDSRRGPALSHPRTSSYYENKGNVDAVWQTAGKRTGLNPATHRADASGAVIQRALYGKTGDGSWEIDHIKPQSKGGSDHIHNLQALNTHANRAFGNSENEKPRRMLP